MVVVPDKGSDIIEIGYKPKDINFLWKNSNMIETQKFISTSSNPLGNNLDYYEGGWHECFPGGGPYKDNGYEQGIHGEAALLPWEFKILRDTPEEVAVELKCKMIRTPFELVKTICINSGSNTIRFKEWLKNLSGEDLPIMWGHHPVFGRPFLDEGCVIDIAAANFENSTSFSSLSSKLSPGEIGDWPIHNSYNYSVIEPKGEKCAELFYLKGLQTGRINIANPAQNLSFTINFDKELFPYVWYWKVLNGVDGYPWYGRTYNIGLEFWTGYPAFDEAKTNGSIKIVKGLETIETDFNATIECIE